MVAAAEVIATELVITATAVQWAQEWEMQTAEAQAEAAELVETISMEQQAEAAEQVKQDRMQLIQLFTMDVEDLDIQEDSVGAQEHQAADMGQTIAGHLGLAVEAQEEMVDTVLQAEAAAAAV